MVNKSSIRPVNKDRFRQCVALRKQGLSYREIRQRVDVAKSTLQNWLTLAGLTLTQEHLQIQLRKSLENRRVATEAARITRSNNAEKEINRFIQSCKVFLNDPFFVLGIILYEAEGSKGTCRFSNSDYRMLQVFIRFLEKYFALDRKINMRFRLFIHITRRNDLGKIKAFWSQKLAIARENIAVTWKRNTVAHRRMNPDYLGQLALDVSGIPLFARKLLALSDIILKKYCRVV